MDAVSDAARTLKAEAEATNERRALVCSGSREATDGAVRAACEAVGLESLTLSEREITGRRLPPGRSEELLGTTEACVVVDCRDACRPNAIGRAAGAVDGGGLLVFATPDLDEWPDRRDGFDEGLAVPPFDIEDVRGLFRRRLVDTLRTHRGIAIVDADAEAVIDDGLTRPAPRLSEGSTTGHLPAEAAFPTAAYEACRTADQTEALAACEALCEEVAVVMEADRGRGKSSAAGLAAGALAAGGKDVLVTAPGYRNAAELFARAAELLDDLDDLESDGRDGDKTPELRAIGGGRIRFSRPLEAAEKRADVLFVDEAAALPVRTLESLLSVAETACFATTIHGYEGAGRGFDVRFRDHLAAAREIREVTLTEPIRYAGGDPIEVWLFRALLLDARPPIGELLAGATPREATYLRPEPADLADDEIRLREAFGLLVSAHYRTEPDDLARLLDAPNVTVRALTLEGRIVSVALLAREGGLPEDTRREIYEGARIRGNMLPDVLTSQLRDPDAAAPRGLRVLRIATHHAVRSQGFGSRLLSEIAGEFDDDGRGDGSDDSPDAIDYLGVGYGATPELLSFWSENGYSTVHLSATRNATSGEYSALMLAPLSAAGETLADRHSVWFRRRIADVLADPLADADPDVIRGTLAATADEIDPHLTDTEWRLVASAAYGPGLYDVSPRPFRRLALAELLGGSERPADEQRLLVGKALQARPWSAVVDDLGYVSRRACMRAFGDAYRPLVDRYGGAAAREEAARYREE